MGAFLLALSPILSTLIPGLKGFFDFKQKEADANQALQLARIEADKQAIVSGNEATTAQTQAKLSATSQNFKQGTFYVIFLFPIMFSLLFPARAQDMWHNFDLMPLWYRQLFGVVYLTIWGIPVAAGYIGGIFSGIGEQIQNRRDYKLQKAKIDRKAFYDALRAVKGQVTADDIATDEKVLNKLDTTGE